METWWKGIHRNRLRYFSWQHFVRQLQSVYKTVKRLPFCGKKRSTALSIFLGWPFYQRPSKLEGKDAQKTLKINQRQTQRKNRHIDGKSVIVKLDTSRILRSIKKQWKSIIWSRKWPHEWRLSQRTFGTYQESLNRWLDWWFGESLGKKWNAKRRNLVSTGFQCQIAYRSQIDYEV